MIAVRAFVIGIAISAASIVPRLACAQYLSPNGFNADLITPAGIHVQTNGQYKTEATRKSAAAAIDRYWDEVHRCADGVISPDERTFHEKLIPEFPRHLSIEIANDWKIVVGPESHRKLQAFASDMRPGAFVTARREEEALYIKVVPELDGLGRQMAGELNLWLAGNTSAMATDLSNACSNLACFRFDYYNAPSEAWQDCEE